MYNFKFVNILNSKQEIRYNLNMALLKEDNSITHIVAIDFGTGATGYAIAPKHLDKDGKMRI